MHTETSCAGRLTSGAFPLAISGISYILADWMPATSISVWHEGVGVAVESTSAAHEFGEMNALQQFLFDHVDTFESLEVLLVVYAGGDREWTPEAAAEQARISVELTTDALGHLERQGFIAREGAVVRYHAATAELDVGVRSLAEAYANDRLAIIQYMVNNAIERLRTSAAQRFADAFQLRGKKNG